MRAVTGKTHAPVTCRGAEARWVRAAPQYLVRRLCPDCHSRFVQAADDRSGTPEDDLRLMQMTQALGGEVWRTGDSLFYFREDSRQQAGPCKDLP